VDNPDGTLKTYTKTSGVIFSGYIGKMPSYTGRHITNILNRGNNSINDTKYYSFTDFLVELCNLHYSSSWFIAGLLTNHITLTPKLFKKQVLVNKQILFKKINDRAIAAIINITGSEKPGLNDKYKNKIIFFQCPIDVMYMYDVSFEGGKIEPVGPPKIGNIITNFTTSVSQNFSYVVDPNKVGVESTMVDWFGGKSMGQIEDVITKITGQLTAIQDDGDAEQGNLEKIDESPPSPESGGKRRTNNNNYAITPKITRVYRNKQYRSKRHSRVNLKRKLMNDKRFMVMTTSKRHSRTHRCRTSRRK
jgi:hypothetical protein